MIEASVVLFVTEKWSAAYPGFLTHAVLALPYIYTLTEELGMSQSPSAQELQGSRSADFHGERPWDQIPLPPNGLECSDIILHTQKEAA